MKRGDYATITNADLKHFESILSPDRCVTEPNDIEMYNMDFYRTYRGQSQLMLKPKTTDEVSAILRHCNARKLAVCPQGDFDFLFHFTKIGKNMPLQVEIPDKWLERRQSSMRLYYQCSL